MRAFVDACMTVMMCTSYVCVYVYVYVRAEGGKEACIYAVHDRQRISNRSYLLRWIIMK